MSETATATPKVTLQPRDLTRNEVTVTTEVDTYGKKAIGKAGRPFLTVVAKPAEIEKYIKWFGPTLVANVLTKFARRVFMEIDGTALDQATGEYRWSQWEEDAVSMDTGMQSLSEIEDDIAELQDKNSGIMDSPEFNAALSDESPDVSVLLEFKKTINENNAKIRELKSRAAEVEAKNKARAEQRAITKAANAAAKAAAEAKAKELVNA